MATSQIAKLTVVVVVEEDESLTSSYRMSQDTKLSELLQKWKDDFNLLGHWVLVSSREEIPFHDSSITLKKVVERGQRIVTLGAVLIDWPTNEIYVCLKDNFHQLSVTPQDKIYDVLSQFSGKPKCLEYNGLPLNIMNTVQIAGIKNKSVIHEPMSSVAVKLSSGCTRIFEVSAVSVASQLKEKVNVYETTDFSLIYQGRHLKPDESVIKLTQVVEVTTAKFVVNFKDCRVTWITKSEPIAVNEFLCQLAAQGNVDTEKLETLHFTCVGCQRRIRLSDDFVQQLPVECCGVRSLTLDAVSSSDFGLNSEENVAKQMKNLHKHPMKHRMKNSRKATSRKIKKEIEILKNQKKEVIEENKRLKMEYNSEIEALKKEVIDEKKRLKMEYNSKIETLKKQKKDIFDENKRLEMEHNSEIEAMQLLYDELNERFGVKLLLIYDPYKLCPASWIKGTSRGQLPWNTTLSYVKCKVPGIRPGSTPFSEVVPVLQRLFRQEKIAKIGQCLGSVAGRTVTRTTSQDGDEVMNYEESPFCGVDGKDHSWEDAGKPTWQCFRWGGSVFVCGGERRTAMAIVPW